MMKPKGIYMQKIVTTPLRQNFWKAGEALA
jgi:hypothetical protein